MAMLNDVVMVLTGLAATCTEGMLKGESDAWVWDGLSGCKNQSQTSLPVFAPLLHLLALIKSCMNTNMPNRQ